MPLEISAGSAAEALIFGTFGIEVGFNGVSFSPCFHEDMGISSLKNFKLRGDIYDVYLKEHAYIVYKNKVKLCEKPYGVTYEVSY